MRDKTCKHIGTHTYTHMMEYYIVFKMNEEALHILSMESSSIYIVKQKKLGSGTTIKHIII